MSGKNGRKAFSLFVFIFFLAPCWGCTGTPSDQTPRVTSALLPTTIIHTSIPPTSTTTSTPSSSPTATEIPTQTPTELPALPKLYLDGAYIRRSDTGEIVQLKGVVIQSPIHDSSSRELRVSLELIGIAKKWGANLIRVPFYARGALPHISDIKRIIEEAHQSRMYVMLTPSSLSGPYLDIPYPNDEVITVIGKLADELRLYNNVILDIWNEAPDVSWSELYPVVETTIQTIRTVNPDVLIGVPGTQWSRDFRYLLSHPLPYDNLIYRVQDIPWVDPTWIEIPSGHNIDRLFLWMDLLDGNHAVMIGEFNYPGLSVFNHEQNVIEWIEQTLAIVNDHGLSYTAFELNRWSVDTGRYVATDLLDASGPLVPGAGPYPLAPRGKEIFDDLQANPPTQFR